MVKETIIGIDLGTTNSCVSIFENGQARVIENSEGARTTPSIVAYNKNGKKLVGNPAKNQRLSNPETTLYAVKRLIGREYNDKMIQKIKDEVSYKIIRSNNGDAWLQIENKKLSPQEVSAEILLKMKETAEDFLGKKILSAVITVPAYFNDAQRQATKDAGQIAGLNVKRIINEPTAAALAYGLDKQKGDSIIAVYDLGGGTFDISIIEISDIDGEHQFEVLATNGDTFLGGEDFDMRIINYLIDTFKKNTSIDLKKDPIALQRLKEAAEKVKIELSSQEFTNINLPYITADAQGPKHLTIDITRAKLESLVEDLIEKTLEPCLIAIKDSGKSKSDINSVILIGGQTRMPKIQDTVKNFFNKTIKKDINPDEAVAVGAAIQGGVLSGDIKDVLLLDVTPLSLGIETIGGVMTKLIDKNTTIPTNKKQVFSTATDNQPAVTIGVYQGEREQAVANQFLGKFDLTDIPPAPKGVPQIEVNFDIDANGILKVTAKNLSTNKEQNIIIKASGGLSEEQIKKMIKDAEINAEADKKFKELVTVKNQADNILHTTQKALDKTGDSISNEEKNKIETLKSKLKDILNSEDKNSIESAMNELSQASTNIIQDMYKKESETSQNNEQDIKEDVKKDDSTDKKQDEDIVDAEYEEQKQNKDKKD